MKRIGIMGGTFNPPHKGHIALAKTALEQFALDEIIFIPSANPPHKKTMDIIDKEHRFKMTKLAIEGYTKFTISRIELDRKGITYAVDTFNALKELFGKSTKLFYIMGLDSINEILDWKKPLELFKLCEFIVGTRPGTKIRTFRRLVKFPPLQKEVDKIHLMELKEDISSSNIRKKFREGKSVSGVVSKKVLDYIKENNLYK